MARRVISGKKKRKAAPVKRRSTTRRRRRISGIGSMDLGGLAMKAAGLGAGALAGRIIKTQLGKIATSMSPTVLAFGQVATGVLIPMLVKNNKFVSDMGDGMIASGIMDVAVAAKVINGVGLLGDRGTVTYRINGTGTNAHSLPAVSGRTMNATTLPAVSGVGSVRRARRAVGCV